MLRSQHAQLVASLSRSNCAVARILLQKFRALRASFLCAGATFLLLALRELIGGG